MAATFPLKTIGGREAWVIYHLVSTYRWSQHPLVAEPREGAQNFDSPSEKHQCRSQIEVHSMAFRRFPVRGRESENLKWKLTEANKEVFIQMCEEYSSSEEPIYELLLEVGFIEAVDNKVIALVKNFVANQIKAELAAAAANRWRCHGRDLRCLSFGDFTEVLRPALPTISDRLIVNGTDSIDRMAPLLTSLDGNGAALKDIAVILVDTVFRIVKNLVTWRSLKGESFEDIEALFKVAMSLEYGPEDVTIDPEFLESRTKKLWIPLIRRFHEEYSARFGAWVRMEEWPRVRPKLAHIEILRFLLGSTTTSCTLNGKEYDASPPLLILLEFIYEYLVIAENMTVLIREVTVRVFEGIGLFAVNISSELLQRERQVTLPTLALSASCLHFCFHAVPLIESKLISAKGRQDEVEKHSSGATAKLKDSYDGIVKRIEHMRTNAAETDADCVDFNAGIPSEKAPEITDQGKIVDWLRVLVGGALLPLAGTQEFEPREGSKMRTFLSDAPHVGSGVEIPEEARVSVAQD
jgi:hypothetical protein